MATADGRLITAQYRRRLLSTRDRAVQLVLGAWAVTNVDDPRSVGRFAMAGAATVAAAQRTAVMMSSGYVGDFVSAETGVRAAPLLVDAERWAGRTLEGVPLGEVMTRAAIVTRVARVQRSPYSEVTGRALLVRRVRTELVGTARAALDAGMLESPAVERFEISTSAACCQVCSSLAAHGPRHVGTDVHFHDHCRCTLQPVVDG